MSARSDLPSDDSPTITRVPVRPRTGVEAERPTTRLKAAIVAAAVGGLLVGLAPAIGLVTPSVSAAFPSWPLLLALALVPPAGAAWAIRRARPGLAAALLIGPAVLAPGRIVLDAQLIVDAGLAARPELLQPDTLDPLIPSFGLWLLLAGHVVAAVAGGLAVGSAGRSPDPALAAAFGNTEDISVSGARRQGLLALVLCTTVIAAVALLMAQFESADPYLLPRAALDSPVVVLIGSLVLAVGVPIAGGLVAGSADPEFARGGLLGLAAGLAGVVVPPVFAVLVVDELHYAWGSIFALIATALLGVLAVFAGRVPDSEPAEDLRLPALTRLLTTSGALAALAGAVAVVAALLPQWEMPAGFTGESPYPARMLWPAGVVMILLGASTLWPRSALWFRPVLAVAWTVVPLASAATLDSVFTATSAAGASAGPGAWACGAAVALAAFAGIAAALAGGVERDDVDLTEVSARRSVLVPASIAAVLAVGAFSLPVITAPGYVPPGVFTEISTTSWGLVSGLVAVIGACVLAPLCRRTRAAALLGGAALVVLVRVLELPVTAGRAEGSGPGIGLWLGLASVVALAVAAVVAARSAERVESD